MFLADPERWLYSPDLVSRRLSLAVWLKDAYDGTGGYIRAAVSLEGVPEKPVRNASGFYCFIGLAPSLYDLIVHYDGDRSARYFPHSETVDLATLPAKSPMVEVKLLPAPNYPFPAAATLIRGVLKDAAGVAVENASVDAVVTTLPPAGIELRLISPTTTASDGQFVVVMVLSGDDLASLPITYPAGIPVEVRLRKGPDTAVVTLNVQESKTNSLGVIGF